MTHDFLKDKSKKDQKKIRENLALFFNSTKDRFVLVLATEYFSFLSYTTTEPTFQFQQDPFVCNYPPLILDSNDVTMFDLDNNEVMFSSSLPSACQRLYGNIKGLELEYPPNPIMKLSDAIRYSIKTKGCLLYKTLHAKENEFGSFTETYLRVTLGPDRRTAPGIPYVLEIWPIGHKSPIHNHGGSFAIIKVLFGRITINVYNKQTDPPPNQSKVIKLFDAKEGDVTWISPNWFQTHHLENRTDDFCATIQCYRYGEKDKMHWPDFDYVSSHGELDQFFPTSDFSFMFMRSQVLKEYETYLGGLQSN